MARPSTKHQTAGRVIAIATHAVIASAPKTYTAKLVCGRLWEAAEFLARWRNDTTEASRRGVAGCASYVAGVLDATADIADDATAQGAWREAVRDVVAAFECEILNRHEQAMAHADKAHAVAVELAA